MYKEIANDSTLLIEPLEFSEYEDEKTIKLLAKLNYLCEENYYEGKKFEKKL